MGKVGIGLHGKCFFKDSITEKNIVNIGRRLKMKRGTKQVKIEVTINNGSAIQYDSDFDKSFPKR